MAKARILEDFVEKNLETIPTDVQQGFSIMQQKEKKYEETRKSFARKKKIVLKTFVVSGKKQQPDGDENNNAVPLIESGIVPQARDDFKAALNEIEEKISIGSQLHELLQRQVTKLGKEMEEIGIELEPFPNLAATLSQKSNNGMTATASDSEGGGGGGGFMASDPLPWEKKQRKRRKVTDQDDKSMLQRTGQDEVSNGEPLYCICKQVSFGDMVACDNPQCQREWFHYQCVGLIQPPVGKWYCSDCLAQRFLVVGSSNK